MAVMEVPSIPVSFANPAVLGTVYEIVLLSILLYVRTNVCTHHET